ncbi:hypothetical protein [Halobellus clavatus]|jgi:hypothetical protein|uniref:Uncharacterized protein n=1 Tax=Halobellus clavatus TaxID=660517 RepID=A0A1H3CY46_9EURY|nr:hypothetical protein [Halobellus clavatus]SDX58960.1 hypothetical protein SAMN04487946_101255 [Halobellus clavatus]
MHATAIDDPTAERKSETRRIDVTDVETAQVAAYAATCESVRFERRGGWTYLVEER